MERPFYKKVYDFLQGESRVVMDTFNSLPEHIKEQVEYRTSLVEKTSPECLKDKKCVHCGCTIPDLFYADKPCEKGCYPTMKSVKDWEDFKKIMKITFK